MHTHTHTFTHKIEITSKTAFQNFVHWKWSWWNMFSEHCSLLDIWNKRISGIQGKVATKVNNNQRHSVPTAQRIESTVFLLLCLFWFYSFSCHGVFSFIISKALENRYTKSRSAAKYFVNSENCRTSSIPSCIVYYMYERVMFACASICHIFSLKLF